MIVICAWCPNFDRNDPRNATASHGMCSTCAAKMQAQWDAEDGVRDQSGRLIAPVQTEFAPRPDGPWNQNMEVR